MQFFLDDNAAALAPRTGQIQRGGDVITVSSYGGVAGLASSAGTNPKTVEIVGGLTNSRGDLVHADVTMRVTEEGIQQSTPTTQWQSTGRRMGTAGRP